MASQTYSFLNVSVTLSTPIGIVGISGTGIAKEGVTIEYAEDKAIVTAGADGKWMTSLRASKVGGVIVRLLKTSPSNQTLNSIYNYETMSSANIGNDIFTITDNQRGDTTVCLGVSFRKHPALIYSEDGSLMEWVFNAGSVDEILGSGTP